MKLKGSMAVEAAIVLPLVVGLIFVFVQAGLFISLNQWAESIGNQAIILFKNTDASEEELEEVLMEAVDRSLLSASKDGILVKVEDGFFGPTVTIQMQLTYEFLFSKEIIVVKEAERTSPRSIRDIMQVTIESASRFPKVKEWIESYQKKVAKWAQKVLKE